ncbi:MAG: pyrroline-5-carboxylate reductase [Kordiimonadaceae bacterium]|nr:pyrroline-5-carboxylate reductase [Kordiimonadaceae bacterium]
MQKDFTADAPLILVGCGHMGQAMALGWLAAGLNPQALYIIDPVVPGDAVAGVPAAQLFKNADALPTGLVAKAVVLAVKPQIMNAILPTIVSFIEAESMVISVAAGVTIQQMQNGTEAEAVYVRAMPNTPAAVGAGITGVTALPTISSPNKAMACTLMEATGQAVWIAEETQMDAVTAVSGSGPAYVFHMVECMTSAGVQAGLSPDVAAALARQTVIGAGQLMASQAEIDAAELRKRVTSPGGTTAAALAVLMNEETRTGTDGLADLMARAIDAACKRGGELSG